MNEIAGRARKRGLDGQDSSALTDEELDAYILARLSALGVDLSRLPEDDADAPADQKRILRSARGFLRSTPRAIADFELDLAGPAPAMYPSEQIAWTDE